MGFGNDAAVELDRHVAGAEQHRAREQLVDGHLGQRQLVRLDVGKDVPHGWGLRLGVGDMEDLAQLVLLPCAVGEGKRQGIVPQHGHDGNVAVRHSGLVVGHVKDAGPGEPEPAIDLGHIVHLPVLSFDLVEPGGESRVFLHRTLDRLPCQRRRAQEAEGGRAGGDAAEERPSMGGKLQVEHRNLRGVTWTSGNRWGNWSVHAPDPGAEVQSALEP